MDERARPSSVLMTTDTIGGVWTYSLRLASLLAERGVTVVLATMGDEPTSAQRRAADAVPNIELFSTRFQLEWMDDPWRDVDRAGEWLLDLESWLAPDVVHLNTLAHAALPFQAPVVAVAHSCVLSWWRAVHGEDAPPRYREYRERLARGVANAAALVAPTRAMLSAVLDHYGAADGAKAIARVIPNAAPPATSVPAEKERLVLSVGRLWDEAKNVAALAAAAPLVAAPIAVAGSDLHPSGARVALGPLLYLGVLPRSAIKAWLARAAIYAHPALYEPFGLSVLEAAHEGCALVLGDIPSLRETWGPDASYVDPRDPPAIAAALNALLDDRRATAAAAARARARAAKLTPRAHVDAYLALYAELVRSAKRAAPGIVRCA